MEWQEVVNGMEKSAAKEIVRIAIIICICIMYLVIPSFSDAHFLLPPYSIGDALKESMAVLGYGFVGAVIAASVARRKEGINNKQESFNFVMIFAAAFSIYPFYIYLSS